MPAVSREQYRLMQAVLHGKARGKHQPSKAVAEEFVDETSHEKRSEWSKGKKCKECGKKDCKC